MENAFVTKGLTKSYRTGETEVRALRGVDLEIPEGTVSVMLGASGSGKSTFLNIIGGLDSPTAGQAWFRDQEITALGEAALTRYRRDAIGFVFQFYNLVASLTAAENVSLVTDIAPDPMSPDAALDLVGLSERADHFPSQLSGGEQQRVAIARAVAKKPIAMLCDEPTGALDSTTGVDVLAALDQVNRELGTTIVMITHNSTIADLGHRVIHFADGRVREVTENKTRLAPQDIEW